MVVNSMKLLYNSTNQLNISQLMDNYEIPQKYRAKAMDCFSGVYEYVCERYSNSKQQHQKWIDGINTITYLIFSGDSFPVLWDKHWPFDTLPEIPQEDIQERLGEYYLTIEGIIWDISPKLPPETVERINEAVETIHNARSEEAAVDAVRHDITVASTSVNRPLSKYRQLSGSNTTLKIQNSNQVDLTTANKLTTMDEIMLDPGFPYFPNVDFNNYWILKKDEYGEEYGIPRSLPIIPECQADISVTTEISQMVDSDFMKLYPNHIMKLRSTVMYQRFDSYPGIEYDEQLGVIFPISGFTRDQIVDNIIKYPDLINIGLGRLGKRRISELSIQSEIVWEEFHKRIEIDNQLELVTKSLWNNSLELSILPPNKAFQQEYVIRKYLLERDNGINHSKEAFGTLHPFITLFMPPEEYIKRGYKDVIDIAKKCVKSRVSYLRSRNPMLRYLGLEYDYEGELIVK